jgi:hypothetical protein
VGTGACRHWLSLSSCLCPEGYICRFVPLRPGHLLAVQSSEKARFSRGSAPKWWFWTSACFALAGLVMLVAAAMSTNWANLIMGAGWLAAGSAGLLQARQLRRRARLGFDEALPAASGEVLTLARQGQRIKAIKRYRQLNPGVGLRDAKDFVDELGPRGRTGRSRS